jgi:hypothetical protein
MYAPMSSLERVFKINKHKLNIIIKYIIFFNWKWPWFTIRHHLSFDRLMTLSIPEGLWGSLLKSRITNSTEIVERPQSRKYKATGQAVKANATTKIPFRGCPKQNFKSSLPFHEMLSAYAAF